MTDVNDQIERFDHLAEELDDKEFAQQVGSEATDLGHVQTFTAMLSEDPPIAAAAEIGLDHQVEAVTVYRVVGDRRADPTQLEPGSGLWRAMEIWWDQFRNTWSED